MRMTEQGDPLQETTTATQLRDFARARFYNYTVLQLVPHYIELREAESRRLPRDTQNSLATSLHACTPPLGRWRIPTRYCPRCCSIFSSNPIKASRAQPTCLNTKWMWRRS